MGCSFCRGHAGQVCSRPGCRDESAEVEAAYRAEEARPRPPVLACGRCHSILLPVMGGGWVCVSHGIQA